MRILSIREAYDHGWQIFEDLSEFTSPRYDEDWESPDRTETVRKIARSQDDNSVYYTKRYLKERLLGLKPQRRYSCQVESTIEAVLAGFYFGDESMSIKQAKANEEREFERAQLREQTLADMLAESAHLTKDELPAFIRNVLRGKYYADLGEEDYNLVVSELGEVFVGKTPAAGGIPSGEDLMPKEEISITKPLFTTRLFEVTAIIRMPTNEPTYVIKALRSRSQIYSLDKNLTWYGGEEEQKRFIAEFDSPDHYPLFMEKLAKALL